MTGGGKDRRLVQFDAAYKRTGMEADVSWNLLDFYFIILLFMDSILIAAPRALGFRPHHLPGQGKPTPSRIDEKLHFARDIRIGLPGNTRQYKTASHCINSWI